MLNGDGLRVVLWVAGCNHCCKECQNPITWDPNGGLAFTQAEEKEIFAELDKDYISGITFSGGDSPASRKYCRRNRFCKKNPSEISGKNHMALYRILWEEIQNEEIVQYLDVCVDGEFLVKRKDPALRWKGSDNQRVIDVPATLRQGEIILHA